MLLLGACSACTSPSSCSAAVVFGDFLSDFRLLRLAFFGRRPRGLGASAPPRSLSFRRSRCSCAGLSSLAACARPADALGAGGDSPPARAFALRLPCSLLGPCCCSSGLCAGALAFCAPAFLYTRLNQATPRRLARLPSFRRAGAVAPRRGQCSRQHSLVEWWGWRRRCGPVLFPRRGKSTWGAPPFAGASCVGDSPDIRRCRLDLLASPWLEQTERA